MLIFVLLSIFAALTRVSCAKNRHYAMDLPSISSKLPTYPLPKSKRTISAFTIQEERKIRYSAAFPFPVKNQTVTKIKCLGNGSFGDVFLASIRGKQIAVKFSNRVKYSKSEYNALRKLDSRYFPKVYFFGLMKCGFGGTVTFFAMEYIKGKDAYQHLVEVDKPFQGEVLRYIVAQLLVSIALVHSKGFFHRDIKPENIMLDKRYNLKLVDFGGIVPAKNDNEQVSAWFGTPHFMAPEVELCFKTKSDDCFATRMADWWSAGASVYYLATFHDYKPKKIAKHLEDANLIDLIRKLCSFNPKDRKIAFKKHPYFANFNWKLTEQRYIG